MNNRVEADYDFSRVPDSELNSCLFYEYLRESEAIIHEVQEVRTRLASWARKKGTKPRDSLVGFTIVTTHVMDTPGHIFEAVLFIQLAAVENFPDVPWQNLPSADKQELRDFVGRARRSDPRSLRKSEFPPLVLDALSKDPCLGDSTLNAWKAKRREHCVEIPFSKAKSMFTATNLAPAMTKSLSYGFFQINLGYDQTQLLDAFGDWLKVNHPDGSKKPTTRRGRNSMRDRLNSLGALRLRHRFDTFADAQKEMALLKSKLHGMYYGDRRSFNRACKAAVAYFRTLLKLPQSAFPIHFKKRGQK